MPRWRHSNPSSACRRWVRPARGQLCDIRGLRCWRVADFPLQWLYFEAGDHLNAVRLLGDRQDIVAIPTKSD
jgi:toxin ParE1/3/4